jgi:hypothetical protein
VYGFRICYVKPRQWWNMWLLWWVRWMGSNPSPHQTGGLVFQHKHSTICDMHLLLVYHIFKTGTNIIFNYNLLLTECPINSSCGPSPYTALPFLMRYTKSHQAQGSMLNWKSCLLHMIFLTIRWMRIIFLLKVLPYKHGFLHLPSPLGQLPGWSMTVPEEVHSNTSFICTVNYFPFSQFI